MYQHLSKNAERQHGNYNTSHWVMEQLKDRKVLPPKVKDGS